MPPEAQGAKRAVRPSVSASIKRRKNTECEKNTTEQPKQHHLHARTYIQPRTRTHTRSTCLPCSEFGSSIAKFSQKDGKGVFFGFDHAKTMERRASAFAQSSARYSRHRRESTRAGLRTAVVIEDEDTILLHRPSSRRCRVASRLSRR